jgi:hypothetical protein
MAAAACVTVQVSGEAETTADKRTPLVSGYMRRSAPFRAWWPWRAGPASWPGPNGSPRPFFYFFEFCFFFSFLFENLDF